MTITLVVACDDQTFGEALLVALGEQAKVDVVGTAYDGQAALREVARHRPDVLVVDAELPRLSGLDVCSRLSAHMGAPRILLLSRVPQHGLLLAALRAGAHGYLSKEAGLRELVDAITSVARGETFVPPRMLGGLLHELIQRRRQESEVQQRYARLSRREREVLNLLAQGKDHRHIARDLVLSPQTVRTHIQNVLGKLEVHSRLEAVSVAVEHGLVEAS